jgi:hypothetical protein
MTSGARPGLVRLFNAWKDSLEFVAVYVRVAHPGERYPHHTSDEQKMHHARDWAEQDRIPWTVAVDALDGGLHRAYGQPSNPAYLIGSSGRVAFRALWAGQDGLLDDKIRELLRRESAADASVNLGEQENLVIPMIHGAVEFDNAIACAGEKARRDFPPGNGQRGLRVGKAVNQSGTCRESG